jgi:hypothetical protein
MNMFTAKKKKMEASSIRLILVTAFYFFHGLAFAVPPFGQYGCLTNRSFSGWDLTLLGASSVNSNMMLFLDFDTYTFQGTVSLESSYGSANNNGSQVSFNGIFSVKQNTPILGSYFISLVGPPGKGNTFPLNLMSVNGGNTLLVASTLGGDSNNNSNPSTGVCQRI